MKKQKQKKLICEDCPYLKDNYCKRHEINKTTESRICVFRNIQLFIYEITKTSGY